ncbi:MAG: phage BR0599 family protein [Pseudomonadota bacterium]
MTHALVSASRADGNSVLLFEFSYSGGTFYRSNAVRQITVLGNTYEPMVGQAGDIESRGDLEPDGQIIPFDLLITDEIAQLFVGYPPSEPVNVEAREYHIGQTEAPTFWLGEVTDFQVKEAGGDANLKLSPITEFFADDLGDETWTVECRHTHYDPETCKVDKAAFTETTTAVSVSDNIVTLPSGWNGSRPFLKFITGQASWTNSAGAIELRRITDATATSVTLTTAVRDLDPGQSISLIPGCNKQSYGGDCQNLFTNLPNFGGHPWLSNLNPSSEDIF